MIFALASGDLIANSRSAHQAVSRGSKPMAMSQPRNAVQYRTPHKTNRKIVILGQKIWVEVIIFDA
ncbi:hypothetical protein IQ266_22105 [filamentous cyanobacterium LEGE 11480]|uniref:Uncharacterized protein n=1 Tax=Romeriopsis navalis LEGE 11480 TaxID=2777977 RepID=A0A928Z6Q0_9CYAN|nr:hypothetical protein [Romeriopsis navalis LEGE 11480]